MKLLVTSVPSVKDEKFEPDFLRTETILKPSDRPRGQGPVVFAVYAVGLPNPTLICTSLLRLTVLDASCPSTLESSEITVAFSDAPRVSFKSKSVWVEDDTVIVRAVPARPPYPPKSRT